MDPRDSGAGVSITCGYSLQHIWLQPPSHTVTASTTLGQACLSRVVQKQGGFDHAGEVYASNDAAKAGGHRPECMAARAMEFVKKARAAERPLFLWLAPTVPHAPDKFAEYLADLPTACMDGEPVSDHTLSEWVDARKATLQRLEAVQSRHQAASPHEQWYPPHEGAAWLDTTLKPLLELLDSIVKVTWLSPPWQCLSSPPVPPQRAPGGSGQLGTPRVRPRPLGAQPSPRGLERAASLKSPIPPRFDHAGSRDPTRLPFSPGTTATRGRARVACTRAACRFR